PVTTAGLNFTSVFSNGANNCWVRDSTSAVTGGSSGGIGSVSRMIQSPLSRGDGRMGDGCSGRTGRAGEWSRPPRSHYSEYCMNVHVNRAKKTKNVAQARQGPGGRFWTILSGRMQHRQAGGEGVYHSMSLLIQDL